LTRSNQIQKQSYNCNNIKILYYNIQGVRRVVGNIWFVGAGKPKFTSCPVRDANSASRKVD